MVGYVVSIRQVRKSVQCGGGTRRRSFEGAEGIGAYNGDHGCSAGMRLSLLAGVAVSAD